MKDKIKAVFFDVDDTLYDSTLQADLARKNAVRAMIEAGLDVSEEEGIGLLEEIVARFGSNHSGHFDELLKDLGYGAKPRVVAAGVAAYHATKTAYLVPFPDTVPTLLKLRDKGYLLGVITDGIAVKQWEKLIRLGLQHFFDSIAISSELGISKPDPRLFARAAENLNLDAGSCVMVGDRLDKDILGANRAGMTSVQVLKGKYRDQKPKGEEHEPGYVISRLSELLSIL